MYSRVGFPSQTRGKGASPTLKGSHGWLNEPQEERVACLAWHGGVEHAMAAALENDLEATL